MSDPANHVPPCPLRHPAHEFAASKEDADHRHPGCCACPRRRKLRLCADSAGRFCRCCMQWPRTASRWSLLQATPAVEDAERAACAGRAVACELPCVKPLAHAPISPRVRNVEGLADLRAPQSSTSSLCADEPQHPHARGAAASSRPAIGRLSNACEGLPLAPLSLFWAGAVSASWSAHKGWTNICGHRACQGGGRCVCVCV